MINSEASIQYANALCQLAIETKSQVKIAQDTKELLDVLMQDQDFVQFYHSKNIAKDDKKQVINKVFKKQLDDYVVNLMLYLVDNADEPLLTDILVKFYFLYMHCHSF